MKEREPTPYWQQDLSIGEGRFYGEPHTIRMRLHQSKERYFGRMELIELSAPTGEMVYFDADSYILEPRITLTVAPQPPSTPGGMIGTVESVTWEGMDHRSIGKAQAWYYPADRALILWECFLHDWCRKDDPTTDENLATAWDSFERVLLEQLRTVERIVTPDWEDTYSDEAWQQFLEGRGYMPLKPWVRVKEVGKR